jgi:membrane associated rhomboid family serine protease
MLRMPWQVGVIALTIVLIFAVEWTRGAVDDDAIQYGFIPAAMMQGGLSGLVTALFIHGSWTHVLINAAFAVAFGAPLARRLGSGAIGGGLFFLFFLVCGVLGNAGYALAHPNSGAPVVGASGAIAGLYAAMSRLLGGPRPLPLTARPVVALGAFWIVGNLMIGLLKFDAGFGAAGGSTAWEAHIAGYLAGLLLMPLFVAAAPLRVGDRQGG